MSALLELLRGSSAFYGGNAAFIEDLYERFLDDPCNCTKKPPTRYHMGR